MPHRILVAELKQETATFNPERTRYSDFRIHRGPDLLSAYRGTQTELAGAFDVFGAAGHCEIVPALAADAVSGGPVATEDLDQLLAEIEDAAQQLSPVDAAYLCLHGAMAGENEDDPEGRLLTRLRDILGPVPLAASLDLHCVLTDRMIAAADILVPYHTYPHTDHYETGQRAARNLLRLLDGTAKPSVVRVPLPMLVRGDELLTATGRFGEAIRMCQDIESSPDGLAAGVLIGNAFTDVPALQSNVLITTSGAPDTARRQAERIGRFLWDHREIFQAQLTPLDSAIRQARDTDGLVIFSDAADATASGAAGDSNAILRGLLEADFSKRTLIPIVDAPAVAAAFDAGVTASITVPLGGTRDATRFQPLTVTARVRSLHDGQFVYENGTAGNGGRTTVLTAGPVSLLVTERPVYVVGRRVFQAFGLEPCDFDLVVVKSPNGFRTWYESIADRIVAVDVPGSTSANLRSLPYQHCVRPIFPLDDHVPSPF